MLKRKLFFIFIILIKVSFGQYFTNAIKPLHFPYNNLYSSHIIDCAIDPNNNIYIAGLCFGDTAVFGDSTKFDAGNFPAYLAKYDDDLNFKWVIRISTQAAYQVDVSNILTTDSAMYLFMYFNHDGSIIFNNDSIYFANCGGNAILTVVKCDFDGNYISHFKYNNLSVNWNAGIQWDEERKRIIISGASYNFTTSTIPHLVVFDTIGNVIFEKYNIGSKGVDIDTSGNVIVSTPFNSDSSSIDKYDLNGNHIWTRSQRGIISNIEVNKKNEIYVSGSTSDSANFTKGYFAKLNESGNLLWDRICHSNYSVINAMVLDSNDNLWINCFFSSHISVFNNTQIISPTFISSGGANDYDNTIMQISPMGGLLNYKQIYGTDKEVVQFLSCTTNNNIITAGFYDVEITFPFQNNQLTLGSNSYAGDDIFLAKMYFPEINPTGFKENFTNSLLNIYPNPAKDLCEVESDLNNLFYKVFDLSGRLVMDRKLISHQINISNLKQGIYFIEFYTEKNNLIERKKIVKN